jgi:tRNA(Ile)-lysidine synthase
MTSARRSKKRKPSAKSRATRAAAPKRAVVVAASGGYDSAAALLLAREAMPHDRLYAVYVDHGLRPRARIRADIAAVRAQARHAGADVLIRRIAVPRRGSVEAEARAKRYAALAEVARGIGAHVVITGHHRDDVVETLLLALMRGSGIDGLAALRRQRPLEPGIALLRPLLAYGKDELREFVRAAGVRAVDDETNVDVRLRRNAVRGLLRELERVVPGASRAMARSARMLREDRFVLESLTATAWQRARADERSDELSTRALAALPPALLRRTIRYAVRRGLGDLRDFHLEHCAAIAAAVREHRGGTFHAGAGRVELSAGRLSVIAGAPKDTRAQERGNAYQPRGTAYQPRGTAYSPAESTIVVPGGNALARDTSGRIAVRRAAANAAPKDATLLDAAALPPGTALTLRRPREGDKCVPAGRKHRVPLARFLGKCGVPKHRRADVTLVCRDGEIVAALGVRVMEPYVPRGKDVLVIQTSGPRDKGLTRRKGG